MKPLKEVFESGQTILWIETQNTVAFLRPVPDILLWTPGPTAGLAQPLRFRQVRFTSSEGLFRPLLFAQVEDERDALASTWTSSGSLHRSNPLRGGTWSRDGSTATVAPIGILRASFPAVSRLLRRCGKTELPLNSLLSRRISSGAMPRHEGAALSTQCFSAGQG